MNEELKELLESLINTINDLKERVRLLEQQEILSQTKVKDAEPDHPYAGMPWVDTS